MIIMVMMMMMIVIIIISSSSINYMSYIINNFVAFLVLFFISGSCLFL